MDRIEYDAIITSYLNTIWTFDLLIVLKNTGNSSYENKKKKENTGVRRNASKTVICLQDILSYPWYNVQRYLMLNIKYGIWEVTCRMHNVEIFSNQMQILLITIFKHLERENVQSGFYHLFLNSLRRKMITKKRRRNVSLLLNIMKLLVTQNRIV